MHFLIYIYLLLLVLPHFIYLALIFKKLNIPSYKGYIPLYNWWLCLRKMNRPWYWFLILLSPGLNIFMLMAIQHDLARHFGFHSLKSIVQAIFFPFFIFKDIANSDKQWVEKTDWTDQKQVEERKNSDIFVLSILSFGLGLIIALIEQLKIFKRKANKPTLVKDWTLDISYAMIAATFIRLYFFELFMVPTGSMEKNMRIGDFLISSRFSYGVQIPRTPLSFPAFHNTVPLLNFPSYLDWLEFSYQRVFPNTPHIERNNVVVFYFPAGDTAVMDPSNFQGHNYEQLLRSSSVEIAESRGDVEYWKSKKKYMAMARQYFQENFGIRYRPVDKRENYVKRCVGLPGDSLSVIEGKIYINGAAIKVQENIQFRYLVRARQKLDPQHLKDQLDIYKKDIEFLGQNQEKEFEYEMILTENLAEEIKNIQHIIAVKSLIESKDQIREDKTLFTFPNHRSFKWNIDNLGPIYLPKKGDVIPLNSENAILYRRAIENYEGHSLQEKDGQYFIDGKITDSYTFQMNYYWMMGDNRHNSADSRNWGYVPEDHIGGKPLFILFSKDPEKSWFTGLRLDRFFKIVLNH